MKPGKYITTTFIVYYTHPDRAEGGPVVTRHFDNLVDALKFVDLTKKSNPTYSGFTVHKQVTETTITKVA